MGDRVRHDRLADVAQRLELGEPRDRLGATRWKAGAGHAERAAQHRVGQLAARVVGEVVAGRFHRR